MIDQNLKLGKVAMANAASVFCWVEDSSVFQELAESWLSCEYLAIDTEFERRTTYYPILALVQIFDGQTIYLIDPLKVDCPEAFREICSNPAIAKIMHSAREDLEVFYYSWRCQFKGLFDTQVAFAFLAGEMSKGYAALVEKLCFQQLDKEATQSDWMKRPLSEKQLDYAAKDVIYLPNIFEQLSQQFKRNVSDQLFKLFQLECDELSNLAIKQPDYTVDYRGAGEVYRLKSDELYLFKKLYQWRELTAIRDNRTKNHILRDAELVQIAIEQPKSKTALHKINDFHPRSFRLYWQDILSIITTFEQTADESTDRNLKPVPNSRDVAGLNNLNKRLLSCVKLEAQKLAISPGLLASKRLIGKIALAEITGEAYPDSYSGWRGDRLKPLFAPIFAEFIQSN